MSIRMFSRSTRLDGAADHRRALLIWPSTASAQQEHLTVAHFCGHFALVGAATIRGQILRRFGEDSN